MVETLNEIPIYRLTVPWKMFKYPNRILMYKLIYEYTTKRVLKRRQVRTKANCGA